jgi:hypothetical protein
VGDGWVGWGEGGTGGGGNHHKFLKELFSKERSFQGCSKNFYLKSYKNLRRPQKISSKEKIFGKCPFILKTTSSNYKKKFFCKYSGRRLMGSLWDLDKLIPLTK